MPDQFAPRPFADVLAEHSGGRTADDLADALRDLTEAVATTGRKGTMTLTLTVSPTDLGPDAVMVTARVAWKPPLPLYADALYFLDADANLQSRDPRQLSLEHVRDAARAAGHTIPGDEPDNA